MKENNVKMLYLLLYLCHPSSSCKYEEDTIYVRTTALGKAIPENALNLVYIYSMIPTILQIDGRIM